MSYTIGIDLGGTNIKCVAIDNAGKKLFEDTRSTQDKATPDEENPNWAQEIKLLLADLKRNLGEHPSHVGFCAPGLAAADGRSIAYMPGRLQGLEGFNWSAFLQEDVFVVDDAKAALLGEIWKGSAQGLHDVIMITLGTGVGGAIYANNKLIRGHIGRAGNLGHISLDTAGEPDVSGMPGSLENAIGNCTISQRSNNRFASTKELVKAAKMGDQEAEQIWNLSVRKLACACAAYINILDPQAIIIGGGIAKAGAFLFERLNRELTKVEWRPNGYAVKIIPAELGEWSGAIGAAYNAILESSS